MFLKRVAQEIKKNIDLNGFYYIPDNDYVEEKTLRVLQEPFTRIAYMLYKNPELREYLTTLNILPFKKNSIYTNTTNICIQALNNFSIHTYYTAHGVIAATQAQATKLGDTKSLELAQFTEIFLELIKAIHENNTNELSSLLPQLSSITDKHYHPYMTYTKSIPILYQNAFNDNLDKYEDIARDLSSDETYITTLHGLGLLPVIVSTISPAALFKYGINALETVGLASLSIRLQELKIPEHMEASLINLLLLTNNIRIDNGLDKKNWFGKTIYQINQRIEQLKNLLNYFL